jgi:uncharacterized protein YjbJ (UPF0337 family)
MRIGTIKVDHVRGFADKLVGLNKELIGAVINNDRLQEEGEAQQARGTESLKALRQEAKAEAKEAKARTHEARQRTSQRAKAS